MLFKLSAAPPSSLFTQGVDSSTLMHATDAKTSRVAPLLNLEQKDDAKTLTKW